jgi:uncharacterized protein (TIGR03435 family)
MWQPIKGSAAWVNSDRYTIDAKAEGPTTPEMMRGPMMQALLEERFKLKIHRESKAVPVYELTVAKGGPKLQPHQEGNCIPRDKLALPTPGKKVPHRLCGGLGGPDVLGTTIAHFCRNLSNISDRDVIDKTGLAGMFDLNFNLPPLPPPVDVTPGLGDPAAPGPLNTLERASRNSERFAQYQRALSKLGLKLEPAQGSGVFLVIDHVEKPSGN